MRAARMRTNPTTVMMDLLRLCVPLRRRRCASPVCCAAFCCLPPPVGRCLPSPSLDELLSSISHQLKLPLKGSHAIDGIFAAILLHADHILCCEVLQRQSLRSVSMLLCSRLFTLSGFSFLCFYFHLFAGQLAMWRFH